MFSGLSGPVLGGRVQWGTENTKHSTYGARSALPVSTVIPPEVPLTEALTATCIINNCKVLWYSDTALFAELVGASCP